MLASSVIKQHTDIQHPIKILELYSGKLELSLSVQVTTEQPCHWSESLFAVRRIFTGARRITFRCFSGDLCAFLCVMRKRKQRWRSVSKVTGRNVASSHDAAGEEAEQRGGHFDWLLALWGCQSGPASDIL